ncbi:spore coat protein GerQ [Rummeliibacillus pycnus]|uniref:spore coat protein GerQ n=1 Tax=Rummeliibacillus pycnus TaxID=101070 RepID=UPI000C9C7E42|nr:spore coat protein GerQ [Rummeliibacillus pycnus]
MVQYYWTPNYPTGTTPYPGGTTFPTGTIQTPPAQPATPAQAREQSYIENILRLNRGKPGTFHFSFEHAVAPGGNTIAIRGVVEAAGRDHVILRELKTNHRYLFPMIYFDYAEFDEQMNYFNQTP